MKKRILSFLIAVCLIFALVPLTSLSAQAADTSGTCGDNLTWVFDEDTGTLTISGTGEMDTSVNSWNSVSAEVVSIVIESGVTSVAKNAFYDWASLESVELNDGLLSIGSYAFGDCSYLEEISIPDSVTSLGTGVFEGCYSLEKVKLSNNLMLMSH